MMNRNWTILIFLIFLMGCTAHRQPTAIVKKDRQFFTPDNWQQPIQKQNPGQPQSTVATATEVEPAGTQPKNVVKDESFQPDFSKQPAKITRRQPPKFVADDDGFKPDFANPVSPTAEVPAPVDTAGESREQMVGYASWYGPGFHGKETANGERYNQNQMTAAHRILPMGTWVQVTNVENNRVAVVRINDRGPYKKNRIIDLTQKGAKTLGFEDKGTAQVSLKVLQYPKNYDPSKGLDPYKQVVVQIAVFKGEQRAYNFKRQLSERYHNIPFRIDDHKKTAFHVIAGPYQKRTKALEIANALKTDGIDNFVRSYRK
ncbi:septal ring lytic transglycosylase RlpA family protein [bacterium]|nr:septal ring lytic transglycosylase RlpA family protein [bacterium]